MYRSLRLLLSRQPAVRPRNSALTEKLIAWLEKIERQHPREIDLDLERVRPVFGRLRLRSRHVPTVTVAGTNGKGSCVAYLDTIFRAAGLRTGVYTSPHLQRFNERICIDGQPAEDAAIITALEQVEAAREPATLTYFEHSTLAALWLFSEAAVDVRVLEVGMGGRLDAVNLVDADVAVITSIDLDHQGWLGDDRTAIAREKAGVLRGGRPGIIGDPDPPATIAQVADDCGARLLYLGQDFDFARSDAAWDWRGTVTAYDDLPRPGFGGPEQYANAACALAAVEQMAPQVRVDRDMITAGLAMARLPGRLQHLRGANDWILDVAHNGAAAKKLASALTAEPRRTIAVVGMVKDKPVEAFATALDSVVAEWVAVSDGHPRSLPPPELAARLESCVAGPVSSADSIENGLVQAAAAAAGRSRILVSGSFHVVGPALHHLSQHA
ncbi:MAG: bifunctional tetrahydrofolate synthase/dihydrofolate synthase [Gammaproteobacteria bacterium]|nr:bifunctional tetrahydrofolate synthase/dihydrofolate synthase [Gammaproteobacteria bacterium]NNF62071.1 bifunctional tetrahydrofolate synthase/dihydrofolate synthase [Gammaproteobacteria bacterium]